MGEETGTNYLLAFGPSLIVAIATIVSAYIEGRRTMKRNKTNGGAQSKDTFARIATIVAAGMAVTSVLMLYSLFDNQILLGKKVSKIKVSKKRTIADFPSTPTRIGINIAALDKDAAAILDGAGKDEWKGLKKGEIRYADKREWVNIVVPNSKSERIEIPRCGLSKKAKLTIRGFSIERMAALVEYTAPNKAAEVGTSCDTGIYFFYRLPE